MRGNLLLAAGTDSAALLHDGEGPCVGHKGILFAFFFRLFYRLVFSFLGIWGFLFSNSFFNFFSGIIQCVTGADPVSSSEAQGGFPSALTAH
jgi:hypothetical protein